MYYLQSRYYMPYLYRFLNADDPKYAKVGKDDTAGINLFAYCNNDPVNNTDPSGNWVVRAAVAAASAAIFGTIAYSIASRMHLTKKQRIIFTAAFTTAGGVLEQFGELKF